MQQLGKENNKMIVLCDKSINYPFSWFHFYHFRGLMSYNFVVLISASNVRLLGLHYHVLRREE